jgi:6-phosphofructokinase 1
MVTDALGYKHHWAVSDYLQRSARHVASATDLAQAQAVGTAAVEYALAGRNAVLPAIRRLSDDPYRWDIVPAPLAQVANREKMMPKSFISKDGFGITAAARRYLAPLIAGEAATVWRDGLPVVAQHKLTLTGRRLPAWGG